MRLLQPTGTWYSVYDGATWTDPQDLDIDHIVPLSEAWASGASAWTTARRQAFANDLTRPQLIAVTDNVNQAKGDKDPADWMPPLASYHCTYVRSWIQVKSYYSLTIDSAEKTALTSAFAIIACSMSAYSDSLLALSRLPQQMLSHKTGFRRPPPLN